jgi:type VI secretion system protein ImpG
MREIRSKLDTYYGQELERLRSLAAEFARTHPASAAPLQGPLADPETERLLEGVAFLTGLIREKCDDEFPEFVQALMELIFPFYLRPVPSISVVAFSSKPGFERTISVPAGTGLPPILVDGSPCRFRTCFDLEVHPLEVLYVGAKAEGNQLAQINMALRLSGLTLKEWQPKGLSFMLGGPVSLAADISFLLMGYLDRIILEPVDGGSPCILGAECLRFTGFDGEATILPYPARSFSGYRTLDEYFLLNAKLLFMELRGWEAWQDTGDGREFRLIFELSRSPLPLSAITPPQIIISATPVVNLFSAEAEPITLDHRSEKVRILAGGAQRDHFRIHSVEKVVGRIEGTPEEKTYLPLESVGRSTRDNPVYEVSRTISPTDGLPEVYLSFPYPNGASELQTEIISVDLLCTNGTLPESIGAGDICGQMEGLSGPLLFKNMIEPTRATDPPLGDKTLWRLVGHLSLNYLPLANASNLKELLLLHAFPGREGLPEANSNLRQIEGIVAVSTKPVRRLVRGAVMIGQSVEVVAEGDHFASLGALYLFGSLLDRFFALYAPMNTFTRFLLKEFRTGETLTWPERMGTRPLL